MVGPTFLYDLRFTLHKRNIGTVLRDGSSLFIGAEAACSLGKRNIILKIDCSPRTCNVFDEGTCEPSSSTVNRFAITVCFTSAAVCCEAPFFFTKISPSQIKCEGLYTSAAV